MCIKQVKTETNFSYLKKKNVSIVHVFLCHMHEQTRGDHFVLQYKTPIGAMFTLHVLIVSAQPSEIKKNRKQ